jgi:hypothetical protein
VTETPGPFLSEKTRKEVCVVGYVDVENFLVGWENSPLNPPKRQVGDDPRKGKKSFSCRVFSSIVGAGDIFRA